MLQIFQQLSDGETTLVDVPAPSLVDGTILVATSSSLVSAGTERMLVDFGKANYLDKARQQPDKVKQVLNKVKVDGLLPTIDAVRSKLDQPLALGYCNAGVVLESDVAGIQKGDRVASNGNHAEVVRVAKNLCVKIPDEVDDESASFTVLGAIALQGIRLIKPSLGETIVVTGLGLVGLISVQMLRANGCKVLGIDLDSNKCELARKFGAETVDISKGEDPIRIAQEFSRGRGVDGVLITASTKSDEVIHQSAQMCRKRGRVVLIGVVGLNLRRDDFFKKEITFQVSASYGPGRYDSSYEESGHDYPIGFVRWTAQRNFEAVLDMMASGFLDLKSLITHKFAINKALDGYKLLNDSSALGILLDYPNKAEKSILSKKVQLSTNKQTSSNPQSARIGFIGAGNYASRVLIPAFRESDGVLDTLVTSSGTNSRHHGKKNGFKVASTDLNDIWNSSDIDTVVIASRHNTHAEQVIASLNAGKNVFVEKPLALTLDELDAINSAYKEAQKKKAVRLMIGFNRRFAPLIVKTKELLATHLAPKSIIVTLNAGAIPAEHWVQNLEVGGGRILGEACHFIDLIRFLVGHTITGFQATMMGDSPRVEIRDDKASITLNFEDGSFGTIHYFANGGSTFPKERVEVFCDDAVLQLDNYRTLRGFAWNGFKKIKLFSQDKGQKATVNAFITSIRDGGQSPIPYEEIMESSRISIEVAQSLRG